MRFSREIRAEEAHKDGHHMTTARRISFMTAVITAAAAITAAALTAAVTITAVRAKITAAVIPQSLRAARHSLREGSKP